MAKAVRRNVRGDVRPCFGGTNWKHHSIRDVLQMKNAGDYNCQCATMLVQVLSYSQKYSGVYFRELAKYISTEIGEIYDFYPAKVEENLVVSLVRIQTIDSYLTMATGKGLHDVSNCLQLHAKFGMTYMAVGH